jgi:type IV pilus assembly protein PilP
MKKDFAPIRWIACLVVAALVIACDDSDQTAQTQVVRKKLVAQTQPGPKAPAAAVSATPNPVPAAPAAAEPVAGVQAKAGQPGPAAPPPKPTEPPPPTQSPPTPAVAVQPARATEPPLVATVATRPDTLAQAAPELPKMDAAPGESQVAALLNIQAPAPYSGKGKTDPFEPLLREEAAQASAARLTAKKRAPQSPLEKIDLGQLKLVAIIASATGNRALVEEASGKGYILREGTYVGLNSGKVVDIALEKIVVEEEYEDVYGKTVLQKKEITLPKPPGEL